MDVLSLAGVILALTAILGGNHLEGGHMESLMQLTAFIIVAGATAGAIMLQFAMPIFMRGLKMGLWVFFPPKIPFKEAIDKIVSWSNTARKEGLLGLEEVVEGETDPFARKGLQLLVDGGEPEAIRGILELELTIREESDALSAKIWEAAGGYTPTVGIIGAVMGLIHVMNNLADPSKLGSGIAVAFVATIYGVGLANLLFLPMASKLKALVGKQTKYAEMIIEGIIAIAEGENPRNIESKLQGYL